MFSLEYFKEKKTFFQNQTFFSLSCPLQACMGLPINAQGGQKEPHYFNDSVQAKAKSGKYLMEKYQSEQYLQLSLKYFVKSFSISELLSKVSQIQTTISCETP